MGRTTRRSSYSPARGTARRLGKLLGAKSVEPARPSPWVPNLIERYAEISGDPETGLATWVREGAPTGVARPIMPGENIIPEAGENSAEKLDVTRLYNRQDHHRNYASVEKNATHAQAELSRLVDEGYATRYPNRDAVRRRWGEVAVGKLACIVKEKDDKTVKVRIIIVFLSSHINKAVKLRERVVLPRLKDAVLDLIDLIEQGGLDDDGRQLGLLAVDFKDAFHTLPVHRDELPFQIAKGVNGEYIGYNTVVFGGAGSPLI